MCLRLWWFCTFVFLSQVGSSAAQESIDELLKQSEACSQLGDYTCSIASLRKARQIAPQNYEVNLLLGVSLLRVRRPQEAVVPLRQAEEIHPNEGAPQGYLGEAFAALKDFPLATQAYQDAVLRSPASGELWTRWADFDLERYRVLGLQLRATQVGLATVLRVQAAALGKGTQGREDLLERAALADGKQSGIWGELGIEQLERGLSDKAAASLKMAQDRQPQDSWTLRLEARMAAVHGNWQDAQKNLLALGSRSPKVLSRELQSWPRRLVPDNDVPGEVWNCLRVQGSADCLGRIAFPDPGDTETPEQLFAEQRWERLVAIPAATSTDTQWFYWGVAWAELSDCSRALFPLERGLDSGTERAAFWLELCYASEAERAVTHLAALGEQVTVHRLRGDILVRIKGDAKAATDEYAEAIRLKPDEAGLLERLAQAYMSLGDLQRAREAAQKALSRNANRPLVLKLLASLAIQEREYSGALVYLNKMLAANPNDAWARVQAGIVCAQTGSLEQALLYLEPALAAGYPDERGALHATLARVLRKLGREQEAQRAIEEAERLANHFQAGGQNGFDDPQ